MGARSKRFASMLDVGHYFGVVEDRQIISSTGVHVYSTLYGVAAIVRKVRIPSRPVGEMSGPPPMLRELESANASHIPLRCFIQRPDLQTSTESGRVRDCLFTGVQPTTTLRTGWLAVQPVLWCLDSRSRTGRSPIQKHWQSSICRDQGSPRLNLTRTGTMTTMVLLAIVALLTTIVAPVLDHHFAERQASHGHVFLDEIQPEHRHVSEVPHGHEADDISAVVVLATGDSDATGLSIDNVVPSAAIRLGDGNVAFRFVGIVTDDDPPSGFTGIQLVRPPIA